MNKWRIYVAGISIEVEGNGDYQTLKNTGLFEKIEQIDYFLTATRDDMWIYRVKLNGKFETAIIKRIEQENR